MLRFFFIILFILSTFAAYSQNVQESVPQSKLESDNIYDHEYTVLNGVTIYKKYTKTLQVIEQNDTIIYVETFDAKHFWHLDRYRLINGKNIKSGLQQEFDLGGYKTSDKFCSAETGKCNIVNTYSYYPNGNIIAIVRTVKNKKEGNSLFYHNNGQLKNNIEFKNNRLWNVLAYYDQHGNILDPGSFCDGNGRLNVYSVTGKLIKIKTYKNGKEKMFGGGVGSRQSQSQFVIIERITSG